MLNDSGLQAKCPHHSEGRSRPGPEAASREPRRWQREPLAPAAGRRVGKWHGNAVDRRMALSRTPIAGIVLVGGIAIAAAAFGLSNWRTLEERRQLEREGVAAVAQVAAVTISHKACNSSVLLRWAESNGASHTGRFMSCFANRTTGEKVRIRYLPERPDAAMLADGEGGLPDAQYRTGIVIGAIVAAVLGTVAASMTRRRLRSGRVGQR